MIDHQSGIFEEGTSHHIFLEFDVRGKLATAPLREVTVAPPQGGHQVVAFGPALIKALAGVDAPVPDFGFREIDGNDGIAAPRTQHDLFIWLHGEQRDELFAQALAWHTAMAGVGELAHEAHGFRFRDNRDLTGFVDGTANPKEDARMAAALVSGDAHGGGSFVLAQRWVHDLASFSELPIADQERVIGRTKADSIELTGDAMPPDSHVSRTDIKRDGQAVKIYRRSSPVGGVGDAGLYFLAFSAEPARFRWLLDSMFGRGGDGLTDRLLHFSRPVTGSIFYAPGRAVLERVFNA